MLNIKAILESPVTALSTGIPFAVAGAYIYDNFSNRERVSSQNIDIRGEWQLTVRKNVEGATNGYIEKFVISWQRDNKFRGRIISPTGLNGAEITLEVDGRFVDTYHALFQYHNHSKDVSDSGAGLIKFKQDHNNGEGWSVNFGVSSNENIDVLGFHIVRKSVAK